MNIAVAILDTPVPTPAPRMRPAPPRERPAPVPVRTREEIAHEFDYLVAVLHPQMALGCERNQTEIVGYCTHTGQGPTRERTGNIVGWQRTDFGFIKKGEYETFAKAINALERAAIDKT